MYNVNLMYTVYLNFHFAYLILKSFKAAQQPAPVI